MLAHPARVLVVMLAVLGFFAWQARHFELDASGRRPACWKPTGICRLGGRFRRATHRRTCSSSPSSRVATSSRNRPSPGSARFATGWREAPGVESAASILDVPLLDNVEDVSLAGIAANLRTLDDPGTDRARARRELLASPVFGEVIVSADARTAAILLSMRDDEEYRRTSLAARNRLLMRRTRTAASTTPTAPSSNASRASTKRRGAASPRTGRPRSRRSEACSRSFAGAGTLHLGGVPMIADDMITFIRNDLVVFGIGVAVFLVIVLSAIFREARWVALPLAGCAYAGLLMIGVLGLTDGRSR